MEKSIIKMDSRGRVIHYKNSNGYEEWWGY